MVQFYTNQFVIRVLKSAQNGIAERMNRTIMDQTRALLDNAGLPDIFWNYAAMTAVYIINCSPTRALQGNMSPLEAFTGQKPNYKNLHVFGCICHSKPKVGTKLDTYSQKCIFLGYIPNGYRVLNLVNFRIQLVRDVVCEDTVLCKDLPNNEKQSALLNFKKHCASKKYHNCVWLTT